MSSWFRRRQPYVAPVASRLIAAQSIRVDGVEALAQMLLDDDEGCAEAFESHLASNRSVDHGAVIDDAAEADVIDLLELLTPETHERYEQWLNTQAQPWTPADVVTVGAALVLGSLLSALDDVVDASALRGLTWLRETPVVEGWEQLGKRLPIDYTGRHFGGPDHRQRSAGHDVARLITGVRQIRAGVFEGVFWQDGVKLTFTTAQAAYPPEESYVTALTKLLAHLGADFVTPMSLPLPGWTFFSAIPNAELRSLAAQLYRADYNMRSGAAVPALGVVAVEYLIRSHMALTAYKARESVSLEPRELVKLRQMLLVGHSGLAASSAGVAAATAICGEGAMALRHLSMPTFARAGVVAVAVLSERAAAGKAAPPTWEELARHTLVSESGDSVESFIR
jgi:hypothetical protein